MNERIRLLRSQLGLSRAAFGQKIGVSGDVINNLERGRAEIREPIIKLICREYKVSYIWLTEGTGNMFEETDIACMTAIDAIMSGENEFAKNVFRQFSKLNVDEWHMLEKLIDKFSKNKDN